MRHGFKDGLDEMSLKTRIVSSLAQRVTGEDRVLKRRADVEKKRKAAGLPHTVSYFHQVDDPYSHIAVQVLSELQSRYDIVIEPHIVLSPPDWAAPDRDRLISHSRIDAERLAVKAGLHFRDPGEQPSGIQVEAASRRLAAALKNGRFIDEAPAISASLWSPGTEGGDPYFADEAQTMVALKEGTARREELGHYLGATFHYGGEWYWGIDRLAYLEERLQGLGTSKNSTQIPLIYAQPVEILEGCGKVPPGTVVDAFLSYRSPYSYLVAERVFNLAKAYGAELNLAFVLPMVMRGLVVPKTKRRYITFDAAREARRLGVPFGKVADPVGEPVERAYSILPWAIEEGKGEAFTLSFMRAVWSEGVDAGSDAGLKKITERAGLDWDYAKSLIGTDDWRDTAEQNRQILLGMGQWGVPSFRIGEVSTWGNDRLWVIEDELKRLAS